MRKLAVVFPGTVALPAAGVLGDVLVRCPSIEVALGDIDRVAATFGGFSVSEYLIKGRGGALGDGAPEALYLSLMAASLAAWECLTVEQGVQPYAVVGQSIGEVWAGVAAGMLTVADGARLGCLRSRALTELGWAGGMTAVMAGEDQVRDLLGAVDHPDLVVACINAPQQTVVTGPVEQLAIIERLADDLGWAHTRLDVPHASHGPALAPAAAALRTAAAGGVQRRSPRHRLISPTMRRVVTGQDDPVEMIAAALTAPVRFQDVVMTLVGHGVTEFAECGENEVVGKFVRAVAPGITITLPLARADSVPIAAAASVAPLVAVARAGAAPTPAPGPAPVVDRERALAELRQLYADYLEYPVEVLEPDAQLEADLGVESLKQVALLRQVADRYDLGDLADKPRLLDFRTLAAIADYVAGSRP